MLLKLVDGGIINIEEDKSYTPGCPTCDYNSRYTNCFDIELSTITISIESTNSYDYPLSDGHMMKVLFPNINLIQSMTENEFSKWLKEQLENEIKCKLTYKIIKK